MSSNRRPWYKWYPKDFVVDEKVQCLSPLAELIYRRALDLMWQSNDIRIPFAMRLLYDSLGKGICESDFNDAFDRIMYPGFELFKVSDDKKWLYSKRLKIEHDEIIEYSDKRQRAGIIGASARWKKNKKDLEISAKQTHGKRMANG